MLQKVKNKSEKLEKEIEENLKNLNHMQMSDLISGALKDDFTSRNKELKKVIKKRFLVKIW